jgi:hypothetical protein
LLPITLEGGYDKVRTPRSWGFGLIRPSSTYSRPGLDLASTYHRSAGRKDRRGTGLRVFSPSRPLHHHGVRGWPAIPRARRYSRLYRDRQNFTSRLPRRPGLLLPYKRTGQGSTRGDGRTKARSQAQASKGRRSSSQAISLILSLFPLRPRLDFLSRSL